MPRAAVHAVDAAPDPLPQSAYVILGMLDLGLRSGYEIKRAVDDSTRHFSAISFRQIYPELKRLTELGYVKAKDAPSGGRRRTFYELTRLGREALDAWLHADDEVATELRHSGLLKLFFADRLEPEARLDLIHRIGRLHEGTVEQLERSRPVAEKRVAQRGEQMPLTTLEFGIELNRFIADWCDRLAGRLTEEGRI